MISLKYTFGRHLTLNNPRTMVSFDRVHQSWIVGGEDTAKALHADLGIPICLKIKLFEVTGFAHEHAWVTFGLMFSFVAFFAPLLRFLLHRIQNRSICRKEHHVGHLLFLRLLRVKHFLFSVCWRQ